MGREEILRSQQEFRRQEAQLALGNANAEIECFKDELRTKHGILLTDDHFSYVELIGVVPEYPGIVNLLIADKKNKESLYDYAALAEKLKGLLQGRGVPVRTILPLSQ